MVWLLALACSRAPEAPPSAADAATSALEGGWPDVIVEDPAQFQSLMAGDAREGWVRYHANDLPGAAALPGDARWRALGDLRVLEHDLDALAGYAWEQTFTQWEARSGLPSGSAIPVIAALNAVDAHNLERAAAWLAKGGAYADPAIADLARQLKAGMDAKTRAESEAAPGSDEATASILLSGLEAVTPAPGPAGCVAAHVQARRDGEREGLTACPAGPLIQENAGAYTRALHDPLLHGTLAQVYFEQYLEVSPGGPTVSLPHLLFSEWWSKEDLEQHHRQQRNALGVMPLSWEALGLSLPSGDDPEPARALVQALDGHLDAWAAAERDAAAPKGRELLDNLQLVAVYRAKALASYARWLLAADRPHQALTVLTLALDAKNGRRVGPLNPPSLFALRAQALLRTGRAREALDSLQPLQAAYPEVAGLVATLEDLAVLQGMSRAGDSKEN